MSWNPEWGRQLIAVDLDGTLIDSRHWPMLGPLKPGAKKYCLQLLRDYDIVVFTARINISDLDGNKRTPEEVLEEIAGIRQLLDQNGLHDIGIHTAAGKPSAQVFIDDRAVVFDGSWRRAFHQTRERLGVKREIKRGAR